MDSAMRGETPEPERRSWRYACPACGTHPGGEGLGICYTCPACGSNLEIEYDYERAAPLIEAALARTGKPRSIEWPDAWEIFAPVMPMSRPVRLPMKIGPTPLFESPRMAALLGVKRLFVKDDTRLPSWSFKDRATFVALSMALELAQPRVEPVICCASTGNAGSSTACLCAAAGMRCVVFVPASAPTAKLAQLRVHGALTVTVEGSYDDAYDLCTEAARRFGWFNRSTGMNPFTREGKKSSILEYSLQAGMDMPDWIVVPMGDGNIISGTGKGLVELSALGLLKTTPRLLGVQSSGSDAICRMLESRRADDARLEPVRIRAATVADSICVDLPRDAASAVRYIRETQGTAVRVDDEEIIAAVVETARECGLFLEPAAAAALAGVKKARRTGIVEAGESVGVIATGSGLKDASAAAAELPEPPLITPSVEALRQVLRRFGLPCGE